MTAADAPPSAIPAADDLRPPLLAAARKAEAYAVLERFRGYDPYDALTSPLFRAPLLRSNPVLRFGGQQVLKRLPVNVRPLLGIPKGYNPVTLGLMLHAYALLSAVDPARADRYRLHLGFCLDELKRLRSPGFSGDCWGYDFPWQSRYAALPAFAPTVVATAFVTNGLFAAYESAGVEEAFSLCEGASRFVLRDLNRTRDPDGTFCWSYSPFDRQRVLNATLKGARLCAQVASVTGDAEAREAAAQSVAYVAKHQREDGSWPYSLGDARQWCDNFHTGYVLECLADYRRLTDERRFDDLTDRGWRYYRENFFADDVVPKYFDRRLHPIDATACAQSLITLVKFGDVATAGRVALWAIGRLQQGDGSFSYQLHRRFVNRIVYMRWSVAWMLLGLATLLRSLERDEAPPRA